MANLITHNQLNEKNYHFYNILGGKRNIDKVIFDYIK